MSSKKIFGSVELMPSCKWCGSNQRSFGYIMKLFSHKVRVYCKDCGYSTNRYSKEIDAFNEWVRERGTGK